MSNFPAFFSFEDESPGCDRSGVWRLLPASIEKLEIEWSHSQDLLYSTGFLDQEDYPGSLNGSGFRGASAWLSESATHKAIYLPRLTSVANYETNFAEYELVTWWPHEELRREFEEHDILLKGGLRVPLQRDDLI